MSFFFKHHPPAPRECECECAGASRARRPSARPWFPASSMACGNLGRCRRSLAARSRRAGDDGPREPHATDGSKKSTSSRRRTRRRNARRNPRWTVARGSSHEPATTGIANQRESSRREITRTSRKRRGNKRCRSLRGRSRERER